MLNSISKKITQGSKRRVGRGIGSKRGGHTAGRGQKGQKSRSGYKKPRKFFEGASNPLIKRLPKLKGFSRGTLTQKTKQISINLSNLNKLKDGAKVTPETLVELGLVSSKSKKVKAVILGKGTLEKKIHVENIKTSKSAAAAIEKLGGSIKNND